MTREEAIKIIKACKEKGFKYTFYTVNEYDTALDMAIKALRREGTFLDTEYTDEIIKVLDEDCISRQAAIDAVVDRYHKYGRDAKVEELEWTLKALPPVTPQQKYEDIAKAFQFGLAFGFGKKYDEMDRVIDEIKKVITQG